MALQPIKTNVFEDIITKANRANIQVGTEQARAWFRRQASSVSVTPKKLLNAVEYRGKLNDSIGVGQMFLFNYDPKTKATLPYYDAFPLVFPIETTKDGFYGLNVHYLPPVLRAQLMDSLYSLTTNKAYDETTRLRMSYKILNSASRFQYFKPCVKRYLNSQVRSRFLYISPSEWDIALFLPLQQFNKASAGKVWADSRKAF